MDGIKKMLNTLTEYAVVNVLASCESGHRDRTVGFSLSFHFRAVFSVISTPRTISPGLS